MPLFCGGGSRCRLVTVTLENTLLINALRRSGGIDRAAVYLIAAPGSNHGAPLTHTAKHKHLQPCPRPALWHFGQASTRTSPTPSCPPLLQRFPFTSFIPVFVLLSPLTIFDPVVNPGTAFWCAHLAHASTRPCPIIPALPLLLRHLVLSVSFILPNGTREHHPSPSYFCPLLFLLF
jgi:hypothetical protein